jgi:hemerythrin-like metal-binding protein
MIKNLGIGTKILVSILVVTFFSVVMAVVSLGKLAKVTHVTDDIGMNGMPHMTDLSKLRNRVDTYRRSELQFYLKNTDAEFKKYADRMNSMQDELKSIKESFAKRNPTEDEKKMMAAFDSSWQRYIATARQAYSLIQEGKSDEAQLITRGEGKKIYDQTNQILIELQEYNQKEADAGMAVAHESMSSARIWVISLLVIGLIIGVGLGLLTSRAIALPIRKLGDDAEQVATGNLNVTVDVSTTDEVGKLAQSFERMINNLREMIGTLSDSSKQISDASVDMQANAGTMADGAEVVAGQAITVATASEEMSATSGDIAQNCMLAAESASRANSAAEHGARVVEKSIQVMHRIAERVQSSACTVETLGNRSDEIGAIVGTIEDIADQTNLLALNAAIEAARAGEQGRGFAVVADEVRALAERTTKATKEISNMIKAIQQETKTAVTAMEEGVSEVEQGTEEAARSEQALKNIQDEINALNLQVQQIATAAEEQTATTSEISSNIHQITDVAQSSVEGARATSKAAQHLSRLAEELQKVVGQFKLSDSGKLIEWSRSYSVGVTQMDNEHKRLIDIINNLYAAMRGGRSTEVVGSVLDELIDYTKTHFAHEEALMQQTNYDGYDVQKRSHVELVNQVIEIQNKFRNGTALGQEVMTFLKNWLINHIQGLDKKYGPTMNKKGIK